MSSLFERLKGGGGSAPGNTLLGEAIGVVLAARRLSSNAIPLHHTGQRQCGIDESLLLQR
jgi:hypothetical protein